VSGTRGRMLTVDQTADLLGTKERFVRRLVAERRITFVRVGRHLRISESAVDEYINAHTIMPATSRGNQGRSL
jgi:excisionase family DNA binding protein